MNEHKLEARTLAVAGGALAQAGQPGPRRQRYRPKAWKDGARCAFALSFDSDHETNELRDGGKSIGRMAWGQYGNRVGVPRILKLLAKARGAGDLLRAGRVPPCSIPTSSAA